MTRTRPLWRTIAVLGVASLALAACGGGGEDGETGEGGGKSYTIAYQGPLSGDNQQLGINMDNAVQLAVEEANKAGDLDFTLEATSADDVGDPAQSPTAAQKLIDDEDVIAVVGPAFSGATNAAEPLFTQAQLASVSPSATRDDLTEQGYETFFRVVPPDSAQGNEAAKYLAKVVKAKKVYSVHDTSDYGKGLADILDAGLKADGVEVVSEGYPKNTEYATIARKVASSGADAMYYSGYYNEAALFARALQDAGYKGVKMTGDGSKDPQFNELAGDAGEGWLFTCPCSDATVDPKAKDFAAAYKAKFNADPGTYSAEAYDSANVIIDVLKNLEGDVTREAVVEALRSANFEGITKTIKFDEKGEVEGNAVYVYKAVGDKIAVEGLTEELVGG